MKKLIIILLITLTGFLFADCLGHKPGELYFTAYSKDAQGKYTIWTLYRTEDYGATAQALIKNFDGGILSDAQPGCFYRITDGETLYFSDDTCRTWTYRGADCAGITTGTVPGQIFKLDKYSTDYAVTWQIPTWNGIPDALYVPLSFCTGHTPGEIYALTPLDQKIYRSTDYGNNFVLQSVFDDSIEAHSIGRGWQLGEILVSNNGVVYCSTDYGLSFSYYNTVTPDNNWGNIRGWERNEFFGIKVERYPANQYTNQKITFYRTTDFYNTVTHTICNYEVGIEDNGELKIENRELANYPNPFNNSTIVNYQLLVNTIINLAVYNSNGEFVKSLYKGQQSAGIHQITFNADDLNSGVYFIKLKYGSNLKAHKILLVK